MPGSFWNRRTVVGLGVVALAALTVTAWVGGPAGDGTSERSAGIVFLTTEGEKALGSAIAPVLADRYGGESSDGRAAERVEHLGHRMVYGTRASATLYDFEFVLLADSETPAAFALPGGRILVTAALERLLDDDAVLAAVLAQQIGHVLERHSTRSLRDAELLAALPSTATLEGWNPEAASGEQRALLASVADHLEAAEHPRAWDLAAERAAAEILGQAGYEPRALVRAARTLGEQPRLVGLSGRPELSEEALRDADAEAEAAESG